MERDGTSDVSSKATVKSWADQWLTIQERRLRPRAYATTARPSAGGSSPRSVTGASTYSPPPTCAQSVAPSVRPGSPRRPNSAPTPRSVSLLRDAMAEGYPVPPRLLVVKAPAKAISDRAALSRAGDRRARAGAALPHGSRWVAALLQGMRQGEALGLTWDAVKLAKAPDDLVAAPGVALPGSLRPDQASACPTATRRDRSRALHLVRPKSRAGWRVIPLVPWMAPALTAWRGPPPRGTGWSGPTSTARRPTTRPTTPSGTHSRVPPRSPTLPAATTPPRGSAHHGHPAHGGGRRHDRHHRHHRPLLGRHQPGRIHASVDRARDALEDVAKTLQLT